MRPFVWIQSVGTAQVWLNETDNNVTKQLENTCSTLNPHQNAENPPNGTGSTSLASGIEAAASSIGNVSVVFPIDVEQKRH
jgi:hypothetical protein